jgi:DNA-binding NtrC family response regulator
VREVRRQHPRQRDKCPTCPERGRPDEPPDAACPETNILAVDANADALLWLVELLRSAGYRVTGAAKFEAARSLLSAGRYDLIVTQLRLEAYNGLHLIFHQRLSCPDAAAIVLAGVSDAASRAEATRLGAFHATLPISAPKLLALVKAALERRAEVAPPRSRRSAAG